MLKKSQSSIGRNISILHRHFQMYIDRELKPYNIGSGQFLILKALYRRDKVSQEEIGKFLGLDKSTTAKNIKRLVKEGYVVRKRDRVDKRAYKIHLTKKAQSTKLRINKVLKRWTRILSSDFTEEEKREIFNLLSKMTKNAKEFFTKQYKKGKNGH